MTIGTTQIAVLLRIRDGGEAGYLPEKHESKPARALLARGMAAPSAAGSGALVLTAEGARFLGLKEREPYTLGDLDLAIVSILGGADDVGVYPVLGAMRKAALHAFETGRVEDRHSAVLRQAMSDMREHGCLKPAPRVGKERAT